MIGTKEVFVIARAVERKECPGRLRQVIAAAELMTREDGQLRTVETQDGIVLARTVAGGRATLTPEGQAELLRHSGSLRGMVWAGGDAFFGSGG